MNTGVLASGKSEDLFDVIPLILICIDKIFKKRTTSSKLYIG